MTSAERGQTKFQINLRRYLRESGVDRDLTRVICEIANASKYIINAIRTGDLGVAGTSNLYGEQQLALDVLSDRIIQKRLMYSGVIAKMASEELDEIITVTAPTNGRYSVAFDPLDGSSLVDVNLAVGTIVSIYEGDDVLQRGRNQVAALYVLYGPRTTMVVSTGNGVHEFAMNLLMEFDLVQENIKLQGPAKIYAPGGARNKYSNGVEKFAQHLETNGAKLRYSGGFVPDINQVLIKRGGIFMYPHLKDAPDGKLRLLYELNPMAFLVEQAGGAASTGRQRILDIDPESEDQRAPIFIGTSEAVEMAEKFIREEEG
ncbi:MAG: class 1 fructose-bisphosphatase [Deltaproteobacteria bacterium]|jgi:fructose-1,6-bisphosphatase I|nr:class 1 fructose-bisphosphatase [Deltaproteobacteria bacterium]